MLNDLIKKLDKTGSTDGYSCTGHPRSAQTQLRPLKKVIDMHWLNM